METNRKVVTIVLVLFAVDIMGFMDQPTLFESSSQRSKHTRGHPTCKLACSHSIPAQSRARLIKISGTLLLDDGSDQRSQRSTPTNIGSSDGPDSHHATPQPSTDIVAKYFLDLMVTATTIIGDDKPSSTMFFTVNITYMSAFLVE